MPAFIFEITKHPSTIEKFAPLGVPDNSTLAPFTNNFIIAVSASYLVNFKVMIFSALFAKVDVPVISASPLTGDGVAL